MDKVKGIEQTANPMINTGTLAKLWALIKDVFAVDTPAVDCDAVWEEDDTWE